MLRGLADFMNVKFHLCIGGTSVRDDQRKLEGGVQIVVGTPGRVNDMIQRNALSLNQIFCLQSKNSFFFFLETDFIKMFVLDEADEMLSRGFKDQIHDLFQSIPNDVQVVLLSATMPAEVLEVTKKFMRKPIQILIKKEELTLEGIRQFYIYIEKEVKKNYLFFNKKFVFFFFFY